MYKIELTINGANKDMSGNYYNETYNYYYNSNEFTLNKKQLKQVETFDSKQLSKLASFILMEDYTGDKFLSAFINIYVETENSLITKHIIELDNVGNIINEYDYNIEVSK